MKDTHENKADGHRDAHGNNPGQDNFNKHQNRENTGQNGQDSEDRKEEKEK